MANTYTQIYLHFVFSVKGRESLIPQSKREELQKIITGIVQKREHKMISIYCMPDHVHLLVGFKPLDSISDLIRDIKALTSKHINENNWISTKFNWQNGYGAFSYSKSALDNVIKYISNQEEHHKKHTFKEEYISLLKKFSIEYDNKYLFEWIE